MAITPRSEELRAVAERLADAVPPFVTDAILTGSAARGVADEHSDIELLVVAERLPDALPLVELDSWSPAGEGTMWYGGYFDGVDVELIWWTPEYADAHVRAIADGRFVDHERLKAAEAIVNGIPLRGERQTTWRALLSHYPATLAAGIVEDVADTWIEPADTQRSLLRVGDALMLAQRLVADAERILRVVFALNETWEPGWKRLESRLEPLATKPEGLAGRIDQAIRRLDLQAMRTLAAETLALAPQTEKTRRAHDRLLEPL